jgi:hypothetical protein
MLAESFYRYCALIFSRSWNVTGIRPAGYLAGYSLQPSAGFAPPSARHGRRSRPEMRDRAHIRPLEPLRHQGTSREARVTQHLSANSTSQPSIILTGFQLAKN